MKKNMKNIFNAMLTVLMIGSQAYCMIDELKTEEKPILSLQRDHTNGPGIYNVGASVAPGSTVRSLGRARGGLQLIEARPVEGKPAVRVFAAPLTRFMAYLAVEFQPGQRAYLVHDPVDQHNNSILHAVLKVLLTLSYQMKNLVGLDEKYANAIISASETTETTLDHILTLPAMRTHHTPDIDPIFYAPVIDGQNKWQLTPAHLCIMWLNPDTLAKLITGGADRNIATGTYKNLLHFLVVYLHDGQELRALFGAVNDDIIHAVKAMVKALVYDHQLPVLPVVRATFAHPDYARGRTEKELEMLRGLPTYIYEPLKEHLLPALKALVTGRPTIEAEPGAEPRTKDATEDPESAIHQHMCNLIAEYTI